MKLLRGLKISTRLYIMFGALLAVLLYIGFSGVSNGFRRAERIEFVSNEIQSIKKIIEGGQPVDFERMDGAATILNGIVGDMYSGNTTVLIMVIIGAIIVAIAAILIVRSIVSPVNKLVNVSKEISKGNILVSLPEKGRDEIGELTERFGDMLDHLSQLEKALVSIAGGDLSADIKVLSDKDIMGNAVINMVARMNTLFSSIQNSAAQVSLGSKQIADGALYLARGAAQQAADLDGLSVSANDIQEQTSKNASVAKEAASMSNSIRWNAEKGSEHMSSMMQAVTEINEASNKISNVIKAINDIAFQTNILALNAAVEAARAGHYGKGFAVVAEEVRNLASRSAAAAADTSELIEDSIAKSHLGMSIADETAQSLNEIVEGINRSSGIIEEIARESEEQLSAIGRLNEGIGQISQVVQRNSALAEQSSASSVEMNAQADTLKELIAQLKLKDDALYSYTEEL